eukprot:2081679-Pyramimonas_sp.AAC.1
MHAASRVVAVQVTGDLNDSPNVQSSVDAPLPPTVHSPDPFPYLIADAPPPAGCIDALLNAYDQEQWWISCGSRGVCRYDGAASAARGRRLVTEVARVLRLHTSTFVVVRTSTRHGRATL